MKALIFAAGLGTRLRPLTLDRPKALVEVDGVPMLGRVIENVKRAGVTDVVVNVHHFARMIKDYIAANDRFGINITVSDESDLLLDTGGGLLKAAPLLQGDEPVLMHNADILTDLDLTRLTLRQGDAATLLVAERHTSRLLVADAESGLLRGWVNVTTGETRPTGFVERADDCRRAFGGIHLIDPRLLLPALRAYATEPAFPIMPFYLAECGRLNIRMQELQGYRWFDIGKPESLQQAEQWIKAQ